MYFAIVLCKEGGSFLGNIFLGDLGDDGGRKGRTRSVSAEADDRLEIVCKLWNVAVLNASGLARDECMDPLLV